MKCDKCKEDFEENDLDSSHDIPKYVGGIDLDGKHWLCKDCHEQYELLILKLGLMNWVKQLPLKDKLIFKNAAKHARRIFFKNG